MEILVIIYVYTSLLVCIERILHRDTYGRFFSEELKIKHLVLIVIFPFSFLLGVILFHGAHFVKQVIGADGKFKELLNKPIRSNKRGE